MATQYWWLISWLEKEPDGAVHAYRTAVLAETIFGALQEAGRMVHARTRERHGMQVLLYNAGVTEDDVASLEGAAELDALGIDWPEGEEADVLGKRGQA